MPEEMYSITVFNTDISTSYTLFGIHERCTYTLYTVVVYDVNFEMILKYISISDVTIIVLPTEKSQKIKCRSVPSSECTYSYVA